MVHVRLRTGEKAGQVVEADASLAQAWVSSGRAELIGPERPETPEGTARRRSRKTETR